MGITNKMVLNGSGESLSVELESQNLYSLFEFDNQNLWQVTTELLKRGTIYPRFRIFVLNYDESTKSEIPQEDIYTGGGYEENYQNGQRRSLNFEVINDDKKYTPSLNNFWIDTKFSFQIGLKTGPSEEDPILWFKKGVFCLCNTNPSYSDDGKKVSFSLRDKFSILEGSKGKLSSAYQIPVGTDIEEVIKKILLTNIGGGYVLDPIPIVYHSALKGKKTQQKIAGEAGTTWGQILLSLAEQASAEIFYNSEGRLTLIPKVEVTNETNKPILYDFFFFFLHFQNVSYSFNLENIVNRVIVIGNNINGGICREEATNTSSTSPFSVKKIGYRTADIIQESNITSSILAKERAEYELRKYSILQTESSNSVFFNPLLSVNNLITVTDEFFKENQDKFLIQSISIPLNYDGIMTISTTNINNLNFIL